MKNFSLKALGAFIFAAGLVVAGVAAPANAAMLVSPSVTSSGTIANSGTNATTVVVSATTVASSMKFVITLPAAWSTTVSSGPTCNGLTVTGINITNTGCTVTGRIVTLFSSDGTSTAALAGGTAVTVTFGVGKLTSAIARDFNIETQDGSGNIIDSATATLASAAPSYAIGYNGNGSNGGSVSSPSTSSGSLTLPANGFTKTNSTFAGWRVGNATSGTIYQPGDTVTVTGAVLVYAQWTDASSSSNSLANTGINTASGIFLFAGGLSLALVGAELFLIARRKRSN